MDLYKILKVGRGDSTEGIKKAYYKKSKEHHPDKGGDEALFKQINEAYSVLSNPVKREFYDTLGFVIDDPKKQVEDWVKSTFLTIARDWVALKISGNNVSFVDYALNIHGNNQKNFNTNLEQLKTNKNKTEKLLNCAAVKEGEINLFTQAVQGILNEINNSIKEVKLSIYRSGVLIDEINKYEFSGGAADEITALLNVGNTTTMHFSNSW